MKIAVIAVLLTLGLVGAGGAQARGGHSGGGHSGGGHAGGSHSGGAHHGGGHAGSGSHSGGGSHARSGPHSHASGSDHRVAGYTKKDGTYVAPHHATDPNGTKRDNYSSKGNVNPYTGKEGTKDPDK